MAFYRCGFLFDNHATCTLEADSLQELRQDIVDCITEDPLGRWGHMHIGPEPVDVLTGPFSSIETFDRFFGIARPEGRLPIPVTHTLLSEALPNED
jgi:hypothetical protein